MDLGTLASGNGYTVVKEGFEDVAFTFSPDYVFSEDLLKGAAAHWKESPGRFDGHLLGVSRFSMSGKTLSVDLVPMRYSVHRYITHCLQNGFHVAEADRIYPFCMASLSSVVHEGKRNFIFGLKKRGEIDGGKLELIPQGFCDNSEGLVVAQVLDRTVVDEIREEIAEGLEVKLKHPFAFVTDDDNLQYAVLLETELEPSEKLLGLDGKATDEHDAIFLVPEEDMHSILEDPSAYLAKNKSFEIRGLEVSSISKALFHRHFSQKQ